MRLWLESLELRLYVKEDFKRCGCKRGAGEREREKELECPDGEGSGFRVKRKAQGDPEKPPCLLLSFLSHTCFRSSLVLVVNNTGLYLKFC